MKILIVLLVIPTVAMAVNCPKGYVEWKGECAADIQPIVAPPVQPSDEKPPEDKMPSYQRAGVTVVTVPNMADEDAKADAEKLAADAEGKQTAGIKPRLR